MDDRITIEQRERLDSALVRQIQLLESLQRQIALLAAEVLKAGFGLFGESEAEAFISWLSSPAPSLGGEIPLRLVGTAEGRKQVATALRRILYGVY